MNEYIDELNNSIIEYGFESRVQSPSSNLTQINSCERNELIAGSDWGWGSATIFETYRKQISDNISLRVCYLLDAENE